MNRPQRNSFTWKGGGESRISFQVTVEDRETPREPMKIYDYGLSIIGSPTGLISVDRERLEVKVGDQVSTLIDRKNGHGQLDFGHLGMELL